MCEGKSTMQHTFMEQPQERRCAYQICRYPVSLIDIWSLRNGTRLTLRPVLPQDSGLLGNLIQGLSSTTRYNRFHGVVKALSADTLQQMTCVDYRQHVAFVITAFDGGLERVVADARFVVDSSGEGAEFALVVDDRWQRLGLGERAMQALAHAADRQGLSWLYGSVLSANAPMLALMQRCQYFCATNRYDERLVCVEKSLGAHAVQTRAVRRHWSSRWLSALRSPTLN
jgi:GNAT superfamily N-acetyltransferase